MRLQPFFPTFTIWMVMLCLWFVLLLGVALGASTGYEATEDSETTIQYADGLFTVGNETEPVSFDNSTEVNPDDGLAESMAYTFGERLFEVSFQLAAASGDIAADVTYHNRSWLPKWVISGGLQVGAIVPPFALLYRCTRGGI